MEAAAIAILTSLGIALPKIIETLFIVFVLVFVLGFRVWPKLKVFFEDITLLRKTATEAVQEGKEAKEAVKELSSTLKEHMVQTDLRMQEGHEEFKELRTILTDFSVRVEKIETQIGIKH